MNIKNDADKHLWQFFLVAYAFSWAFWIPDALAARGAALPAWLAEFLASPLNPAAFGPTVAAFVLTLLHSGGGGAWHLLKRGVDWRFKKKWLLAILLAPLLIFGGAGLAAALISPGALDLSVISNPPYAIVAFFVILFTAGPLQEEFGWRGYALPRLQARFSPLASSLILGFFWWLWHLPAVFIPGRFMTDNLLVFLALLAVVGLTSILFTWVYNNTGGSILAALLMDAAMNWSIWLFRPSMKMELNNIGWMIGFLVAALLIVRRWGMGGAAERPK